MRIISKGGTFLKARPVLSTILQRSELYFVSSGVTLEVNELRESLNGHRLVELNKPLKGRFNWWIFVPHWNLGQRFGLEQIDWHLPNSRVSKYFTVNEVTMGDARRIPTEARTKEAIYALAVELDKVREAWGAPLIVTSWYRPEPINTQVGGVRGSSHTFGHAADICPVDGDYVGFEQWLDKFWGDRALGYGQAAGRGFTHVDLRPGRIRWDY